METADRYFSQRYFLEHNLRVCLVSLVEKGLPGIIEMAALEDSTPASLLDSYLEFLEGKYQDIHLDHFVTTIRNHIRYLNNKYDDESDFRKHFSKFLKQNIKELEHTIRFHELFSATVLVELSNRCKADSSEDKFNEVIVPVQTKIEKVSLKVSESISDKYSDKDIN